MDIRLINYTDVLNIRHRVLWPDRPKEFCILDDDVTGIHYGGYIDGKLISVASIFMSGREVRLRKFATLVKFQGVGYGSKILNRIIDDLSRDKKVNRFWCDARISAIDFYSRFGMHQKGGTFLKSGIEYVVMEREI